MKKCSRVVKQKKAQTFIEYSLVFGIVVSLLIAMTPLIRRGIQGMVKVVADQVGNQQEADQAGGDSGYLINSYTVSQVSTDKRVVEGGNRTGYEFTDDAWSDTISLTNTGFRPN